MLDKLSRIEDAARGYDVSVLQSPDLAWKKEIHLEVSDANGRLHGVDRHGGDIEFGNFR